MKTVFNEDIHIIRGGETMKWTGWETDKFQGLVATVEGCRAVLRDKRVDWAYYHSPIIGQRDLWTGGSYETRRIESDQVYFVNQCGDEVASWGRALNVLLVFGKPRKVCRLTNPDGIRHYREVSF